MKLCDLKFNKNAIIKDIKFTDNIKRRVNAFWDMIIKDVNNE